MSSGRQGFFALFEHLDSTIGACKALRAKGYEAFRAYAPLPEHHLLEDGLGLKYSPVRVFTLVGGLTGAATGFAFTSWTSVDWPLITGGKPILSIPAYVVIAFELMVLFGALATYHDLPFLAEATLDLRPVIKPSEIESCLANGWIRLKTRTGREIIAAAPPSSSTTTLRRGWRLRPLNA